jgi:hypothetical protein
MKRSLLDLINGDSGSSAKITRQYRPIQACGYLLDEGGGLRTVHRGDVSWLSEIVIPLGYKGSLLVKYHMAGGYGSESRYELGEPMRPTRVLGSYPDSSLYQSDITQDFKDALHAFARHLP